MAKFEEQAKRELDRSPKLIVESSLTEEATPIIGQLTKILEKKSMQPEMPNTSSRGIIMNQKNQRQTKKD